MNCQAGLLVFVSLVIAVSCHTNMISVNNDRSCVRPFSNDSPVMDIYNDVMRCNGRNSPAGGRCQVQAGGEITLRWYHGGTGVIDPSHKGPIAIYLAAASTGGYGDAWFKIAEDGYNGRWAVERLIDNGGNFKVRIPSNLASGDYILRTELIAHHESFRAGGAQYYVGCADLFISGGSGGDCSPKVSIPGGGWVPNFDDPTVKVNIYNGAAGYRVPGPNVANCAGGGGGGNAGGGGGGGGGGNNNPPPGSPYSCDQQKEWGKCGEPWMNGYCCQACGTCGGGGGGGGSDNPPSGSPYSCAQQKEWGKCGESWMRGYCCRSCGNC